MWYHSDVDDEARVGEVAQAMSNEAWIMLNAHGVRERKLVCHMPLPGTFALPFNSQCYESATVTFSDALTNWTDAHCCYTHKQYCLGVRYMLEERKPPHQF